MPSLSSSADSRRPVKSLLKALRILDVLGESESGLGVTVLSRTLKAPKSTVYRLVTTLQSGGYISFDPVTAHYDLGSRVVKLGEQLRHRSPLLSLGPLMLERLTRESDETSYLAVREGTEVAVLAKEESKGVLRIAVNVGYRSPAHCTALGRACLSGISDREIVRLYRNKKLHSCTPRTKTRLDAVLREVAAVRRTGIAVDREEYAEAVCCIAAPIRDSSSQVIAAITLATTRARFTPEREALFRQLLLHVTDEFSQKLGYIRKD